MLRVLIIDDEKNTRDVIASILAKRCPTIQLVGNAESVETGLKAIAELKPDLVLLDIHLSDGSGFDLLHKLATIHFKLIFITAYEQYAIKAFKFSACDYILKPINSIELSEAIQKVEANYLQTSELEYQTLLRNIPEGPRENKKVILKTFDSIYAISINDIIRCESDAYYTRFFIADGQVIMVSNTLKYYDEMLTEYRFFRIHQSHLINLDYLVKFKKADGGFAVMKDGAEIPVSFRKKDLFLDAIEKM